MGIPSGEWISVPNTYPHTTFVLKDSIMIKKKKILLCDHVVFLVVALFHLAKWQEGTYTLQMIRFHPFLINSIPKCKNILFFMHLLVKEHSGGSNS